MTKLLSNNSVLYMMHLSLPESTPSGKQLPLLKKKKKEEKTFPGYRNRREKHKDTNSPPLLPDAANSNSEHSPLPPPDWSTGCPTKSACFAVAKR